MIFSGALPPGQRPAHGTLVAPQVYGPNHQHIFCVRLDMMVDGPGNTVLECDSVALPPGPDPPATATRGWSGSIPSGTRSTSSLPEAPRIGAPKSG